MTKRELQKELKRREREELRQVSNRDEHELETSFFADECYCFVL